MQTGILTAAFCPEAVSGGLFGHVTATVFQYRTKSCQSQSRPCQRSFTLRSAQNPGRRQCQACSGTDHHRIQKYSCHADISLPDVIIRFIYGLVAFAGCMCPLQTVWDLSDICNGLMAVPSAGGGG